MKEPGEWAELHARSRIFIAEETGDSLDTIDRVLLALARFYWSQSPTIVNTMVQLATMEAAPGEDGVEP